MLKFLKVLSFGLNLDIPFPVAAQMNPLPSAIEYTSDEGRPSAAVKVRITFPLGEICIRPFIDAAHMVPSLLSSIDSTMLSEFTLISFPVSRFLIMAPLKNPISRVLVRREWLMAGVHWNFDLSDLI